MKKKYNFSIIEDYLRENNLSATQFCKLCNISYGTYKKVCEQKTNIRISIILKIISVLNIKVVDFLI